MTGKPWLKGERPHVWRYQGLKHEMHYPFLRSKAQAKFRNENWELDIDDYYEVWKDHWDQKGRKPEEYCLTRKDSKLSWHKDNIVIITRREQLQLKNFSKRKRNGDNNA